MVSSINNGSSVSSADRTQMGKLETRNKKQNTTIQKESTAASADTQNKAQNKLYNSKVVDSKSGKVDAYA